MINNILLNVILNINFYIVYHNMIQNTASCNAANNHINSEKKELIKEMYNTIFSLFRLLIATNLIKNHKISNKNPLTINIGKSENIKKFQTIFNKIVFCPITINVCYDLNGEITGMFLKCKCKTAYTVTNINHSEYRAYNHKFIVLTNQLINKYNNNKTDLTKYKNIMPFFVNIMDSYKKKQQLNNQKTLKK